MKIPGGFGALRQCLAIRDYRYYVAGNVTHGLGIWLLRMTIGWLAWKLTESTAWLGTVAMAESAPSLLLSLFAGTVVDRFNFVRLLQITQGLSALLAATLAVLTLTGAIDIWILFFLTLLRGSLMAFNRPSRMVLVHHMVGRDLLAPALALGSIIHNGTRFIGPALGGVIIAGAGTGWGFIAASILIGFYSAVLIILGIEIEPRKREPRSMRALFVATDIVWVGLIAVALFGAGLLVLNVTSQTLIQSAVEPAFRGRVISVHGLVMIGVPALGAIALGLLGDLFGLRLPVVAGALIFALVGIFALSRRAALRASLEHQAGEAAPAPHGA